MAFSTYSPLCFTHYPPFNLKRQTRIDYSTPHYGE
nr:MAG TPA: hypothetical protein [Caudoviricetes sp.]